MTVSDQNLIVSISVEALCVGKGEDTEQTFVKPEAEFSQLPYLDSGWVPQNQKPPLSENLLQAPFESETSLDAGVHLHWALPDALTHGYHHQEHFAFPDAPNRWLVTRFWTINGEKKSQSWVVESNYLHDAAATNPAPGHNTSIPQLYTNDNQNGPTWRYMGRFLDFESWREGETGNPSPNYFPHLNALGYGDPVFAAQYQNCRGVFGFYDDLNDPDFQSGPITIAYTVTGWYSPGANDALDPTWLSTLLKLNGITPTTRSENVARALELYKWQLTHGAVAGDLNQTFCSGVVVAVDWDPHKNYLSTEPITDLTIGLGNTRAEAFSTVLAHKMNTDDYGDLEQLLNALQYGVLPEMATVDGVAILDELLHQSGFQAHQGGPIWAVSAPKDGQQGQLQEIDLPAEVAELLNQLNDGTHGQGGQAQYNRDTATLEDLRWRVFTYWYKYAFMQFSPFYQPPASWPTPDQVIAFLQLLVGDPQNPGQSFEIQTRTKDLTALKAKVTTAASALQTKLRNANLPFLVDQVPGPRYWQPNEPVLMFDGKAAEPAARYGGDGRFAEGMLTCRGGAQLITVVKGGNATYQTASYPHLGQPNPVPDQYPALDGLYQEGWLFEAMYQADPDWQKLMQTLESGAQAPGQPPSPVEITAWSTPWLPIECAWEVDFLAAGTTEATGLAIPYGPDYIAKFYRFDQSLYDFVYKGSAPDKQLFSPYWGRTVLTPGANDLAGQLRNDLRYQQDPELQAIARGLDQLPLLAQGLGGFNDAFLMRRLTMQLQVIDMTSSSMELLNFTNQNVRQAVAGANTTAPLPDGVVYCPIRAGFGSLSNLRIIDAFGRFRDVGLQNLLIAKPIVPPASLELNGYFALPPRLAQPARLSFRWLSAEADLMEMNSHPATSPVCGWLLPNYLDGTLMVFGTKGMAIGYLAVNPQRTGIVFYPAPGLSDSAFEQLRAGMNPHFKNTIDGIMGNSAVFFQAFLTATNKALGRVEPENYRSTQSLAALMGRPLAVTRTSLKLEMRDPPATDVSWSAFSETIQKGNPDYSVTHNFPEVRFPVFLGDPGKVNDGLTGYFVEGGAAPYQTFFSPALSEGNVGVEPVGPGLPVTPNPGASATTLTMLVDPRAAVHAATGILPVKAIDIPANQYLQALKHLEITFNTGPILTRATRMELPLPTESNGNWSWLEHDGTDWTAIGDISKTSDRAVFHDSGQVIRGGWLKLSRAFGEDEDGIGKR